MVVKQIKNLVIIVCILLILTSISLIIKSSTLIIDGNNEVDIRDTINADTKVVGKSVGCVTHNNNNFYPIFEYKLNGNKFSIESKFILCNSEEQAIKYEDITVKVNSKTEKGYIVECENIYGKYNSISSMINKARIHSGV